LYQVRTLGRWRKRASLAEARKGASKHCPQALTGWRIQPPFLLIWPFDV
jgi:hypothetical protein